MYKPDEKDIDRLSREAAEHYHAPGKPAWDALQQVLDKELPQEEERKRRGFFFFFFLLLGLSLTGSVLWYGIHIIKNKQQPAITAQAKHNYPEAISGGTGNTSQPVAAGDSHGKAAASSSSNTTENENGNANNNIAAATHTAPAGNAAGTGKTPDNMPDKAAASIPQINAAARPASPKHSGSDTPPASALSPVRNTATAPAKSNKKINKTIIIADDAFTATGKQIRSQKKRGNKNQPGNEDITVTGNRSDPGTKHGNKSKKSASAAVKAEDENNDAAVNSVVSSSSKAVQSNNINDSLQAEDTSARPYTPAAVAGTDTGKTTSNSSAGPNTVAANEKTDATKAVHKKKTTKNNKAINIGLTAGMDISTVKFTHGDNAGYNFGLMAGYQFNRRWSVYTGIIYTKKNYKLEGKDYHPPKHYWTQYVQLETVEGYCLMWELPLQARYTFNPGAKTAFFASAGLSSYFMKKQQYDYAYKNNMNQQLTAAWSNDSTFNHVFSILHLSAGFEKPLGRHMNWQIEPYAKIPLGGVGFGNIRLSSFGVNFSVQYRQRMKR